MRYITTVNQKEFLVEIVDDHQVLVNGQALQIDFGSIHGQPVFTLLLDGHSYEGFVYPGEEQLEILLMGRQFPVKVEDERERRLRATAGGSVYEAGEFHLKSPMPGMVVSIPVEEGQTVEKGQVLVILESMKMQNELKSPRSGTIHRIRVQTGESVEQKQTLLSVQ